ncbi:MAG TPA: phage tail protein [Kofleriaceae bacterium]|nr:phage tail protein [Kofleriaceae bacterium]
MTLQKRSYTAGHFELQIDGHASTAYLKSVDGGYVRASTVDEPVGPENMRVKHTSVVDIEPFSIDFGIAGANDVLRWIQASWRKQFGRRNGQITHANFDLYRTFEHEFFDALISETTFPALDGSSKDAAFMKIKIQPERVLSRKSSGGRVQGNMGTKQKLWTPSSFRLTIDGLDEMKFTNKIESFTIKQGIKKLYTGEDRYPSIEPTKIEFPNVIGTISLEYADRLLQWYHDYVVKGMNDVKAQKTGAIEFLAPDKKSTLFRINLYEMGIHHAQVVQATANSDQIKRVKFELYVGRMDIDGGGTLGMD